MGHVVFTLESSANYGLLHCGKAGTFGWITSSTYHISDKLIRAERRARRNAQSGYLPMNLKVDILYVFHLVGQRGHEVMCGKRSSMWSNEGLDFNIFTLPCKSTGILCGAIRDVIYGTC
jgi:hypothetical protein